MNTFILSLLLLFSPVQLEAPEPLDMTNIVNATVRRYDVGQAIFVLVTVNLNGGGTYRKDFYITPEDVAYYKNGGNPEKLAIARKYIRKAIKEYLISIQPPPAPVDQGTQTVSKANILEPGDIN